MLASAEIPMERFFLHQSLDHARQGVGGRARSMSIQPLPGDRAGLATGVEATRCPILSMLVCRYLK